MLSPHTCFPLRIAHVLPSLEIGGMEALVINLSRETAAAGDPTSIFVIETEGTMAATAREYGLPVIWAPTPGLTGLLRQTALVRALRQFAPDVVHAHSGAWPKGLSAGRKIAHAARVYTQHGMESKAAIVTHTGRMVARYTDRAVGVSVEVANELTGRFGMPASRVSVIDNGVSVPDCDTLPGLRDTTRKSLQIPSNATVVMHVGRLVAVKNQAMLLRAFDAAATPDSYLLVTGDGPERQALVSQRDALASRERILLLGVRSDISALLPAADVFAMSSDSEGMPISLLEAMAVGLTPVCTDVGAISEAVKDGVSGLLAGRGDERGLSEQIARALNDRALRTALGVRARQMVVERFSVATSAAAYRGLYLQELSRVRNPKVG